MEILLNLVATARVILFISFQSREDIRSWVYTSRPYFNKPIAIKDPTFSGLKLYSLPLATTTRSLLQKKKLCQAIGRGRAIKAWSPLVHCFTNFSLLYYNPVPFLDSGLFPTPTSQNPLKHKVMYTSLYIHIIPLSGHSNYCPRLLSVRVVFICNLAGSK